MHSIEAYNYTIKEHIESNWAKSSYALSCTEDETTWGGRKGTGWKIILTTGLAGFIAFILLFLYTIVKMLDN